MMNPASSVCGVGVRCTNDSPCWPQTAPDDAKRNEPACSACEQSTVLSVMGCSAQSTARGLVGRAYNHADPSNASPNRLM
jgi:hypothetical protein